MGKCCSIAIYTKQGKVSTQSREDAGIRLDCISLLKEISRCCILPKPNLLSAFGSNNLYLPSNWREQQFIAFLHSPVNIEQAVI